VSQEDDGGWVRTYGLTAQPWVGCQQGSITGAFSPLTEDVTPSFVLLAVQDTKIVCYVYELTSKGEVDVSKTEFTKQQLQQFASPPTNPALLESLLK
jgi:vacuolar protein sorting-associated protein 29